MKILITGGCGFIGSNYIIKQINEYSNAILNIDKLTYAGNIENLIDIENHPNYSFLKGDICNYDFILDSINRFSPEAIVHFAAESHVDRSIDTPLDFINTNILGTSVLLDISLKHWRNINPDFKFIHVSTDEVFGELGSEGFFTEDSPYDPSSPYSASKAGADHLVSAWIKTYNFPAMITNCSNNYGPYQFPEKLIPLMIANCLNEEPLPIYGDGKNIRDWLFVDDHCDAINNVLSKGKLGNTYNIGGYNEIQNITIVKTICKILDDLHPRTQSKSYLDLITYVKDRPGHDFRYAIDATKIEKHLGWVPKETFETGILKTVTWYLNNKDWSEKIKNKSYSQQRLGLENV